MKRLCGLLAAGILCSVGTAFADASFRQVIEVKINVPIPPGAALPGFPFSGPLDIAAHVKGTRAYSTYGQTASIMDWSNNGLTLIDNAGKRYATTSLSDYMSKIAETTSGAMPEIPEAAMQVLRNIQFNVESHQTDRSERINGIDCAESETLLRVNIPIPMPMPGLSDSGMELTGTFQVWRPKPAELERVPGLREVNAYYQQASKAGTDISSTLSKMFSALPELGTKIGGLMEEMQKGGALTVRMHGAFSMPALAAILQQAKAGGADVPSIPDGPLFEFNSALKDFNTDAVPDSTFQVPEGYKQAPLADVIKTLIPGQ